jgi:hypothetical protein
MTNKVKWQRVDGQAIPFMFEEINGRWLWVKYQSSKVYVPDRGHSFSKGYLSFLNALKQGYVVEYSSV